jgi:hypothetical protein
MEYAGYIAIIAVLALGIILYLLWKPRKARNRLHVTRTTAAGGDPFHDRMEFYLRDQDNP